MFASLNHQNVAAIYGLEEPASDLPTTPDPIGSGLPLDETLAIDWVEELKARLPATK